MAYCLMRQVSILALAGALAAPGVVLAAGQAPANGAAANDANVSELVITARKLDEARATIEPSLGASTYTLSSQFVDNLPGGQNIALNQVVLQAPGVTQDSYGQLHIRGDHANIQYRLNNVILPEGLSVFGQTLSPRLASSTELITGALPAQYGLRTAGIVNITTRSGLYENGGQVSMYGGSHGEIEPSFEYGGHSGSNNFFVSGSFMRNDLGIESPDGSSTPLHDRTDQIQLFGYLNHIIDDSSSVSLIAGTSNQRFQIPDVRGLNADQNDPPLNVNGQTSFASENLNQSQRETTDYAIASYLRSTDKLTLQLSTFVRYSTLTYRPDILGELLFNGISQYAAKRDFAAGVQAEGVYKLNDAHTLRGGVVIQGDRSISRTTSEVLPVDGSGAQTSNVPEIIIDNGQRTGWTYSVFLQDEWKLSQTLTLNYGLRFDEVDALRNERQLSPRVNVVWKPTDTTTLHAGYARYFTPPPFELVAAPTISKFAGTTAASLPGALDTTPFSERDDYYDVGVQQRFGELTLGVDGYLRNAKNLIDEGQFGAPIILTPFNYAVGRIRGVEFTATYAHGPFSAYGNLALSKAQGKDIVSSQFNFDPAELAFIQNNFIYLDHNQTVTGSAGASYRFGDLKVSGDILYGSGLRTTPGIIPNGGHVPGYVQLNLSASYHLALGPAGPVDLRFDIINVNDEKYEIRDGSGVGVGAPQWGPRRGFFGGITKSF